MWTRCFFAILGLVGILGLTTQFAPAQDPNTQPPADVVPSTFRMFLVTDSRFEPLRDEDGNLLKDKDGNPVENPKNRQGKIHCLVCENGLAPMVVAFVAADPQTLGVDSGVGKLAQRINTLIPQYRGDKLSGFIAFLRLTGGKKTVNVKVMKGGIEVEEPVEVDLEYPDDENRDEHAKAVGDLARALDVPNVPFGLAAKSSKAAAAWGVRMNKDPVTGDETPADAVTVVMYNRMRIVKTWRFATDAELTDAKLDEIVKTTEQAITGKKQAD